MWNLATGDRAAVEGLWDLRFHDGWGYLQKGEAEGPTLIDDISTQKMYFHHGRQEVFLGTLTENSIFRDVRWFRRQLHKREVGHFLC